MPKRGIHVNYLSIDFGAWDAAYTQAQAFIAGLSNADKLNLTTGSDVTSANWTSLVFLDGTQGPQGYEYITGWAEPSAPAHSWDTTIMWNQFKGVAAEFYNKGIQVTNASRSQPLGRTPWGGRLVETMGQDSYLNGIMFGLGIKTFSETGIYEFGYGLSYTNFTYSNLEAEIMNSTALGSTYPTGILSVGGKEDLWTDVVSVNATITNSGSVAGNQVAQLYLGFPDEADEPVRQLRGFEKSGLLAAGDEEILGFALRRRDLSVWDTTAQEWILVKGTSVVIVETSSRDLRMVGNVTVV